MVIEHQTGALSVRLVVGQDDNGAHVVERAGVVRTARMLFRGDAYVRSA